MSDKTTKADFIRSDDWRWREMLEDVPHDIYHLPEYLNFAARHEGGEPLAFYVETETGRCLIPLLKKELPCSIDPGRRWCDVTSPYGYASPLTEPEDSQTALQNALSALAGHQNESGLLSAFIRFHPLMMQPDLHDDDVGVLVSHGQTVYLDLSLSNEEIWRQTRKNHRVGIQKLLHGGFEATINDFSLLAEFIDIYHETMARVGAKDFYLFSHQYFKELFFSFEGKVNLVCILSPRGDIASGGVFTSYGKFIQFHLAGTKEEYVKDAPTKMMFDFVRRWGIDNGYQLFHLGGGVGASADQLFHFKAGFSGLRGVFHTLRTVINSEHYSKCCRQAFYLEPKVNEAERDFFPGYRTYEHLAALSQQGQRTPHERR